MTLNRAEMVLTGDRIAVYESGFDLGQFVKAVDVRDEACVLILEVADFDELREARERADRLIAALDGLFDACDCGSAVKPTCFGAKDGGPGFGCDECCAHEPNENEEDGWCVPLRPASTSEKPTPPPETP